MREASPGPMLRTWALAALTASTSRKSSASASGTGRRCQLRPPSVVRSTVPSAPLAHATSAETALTPRSRTVTPLGCDSHWNGEVWALGPVVAKASTTANRANRGREAGRIGVILRDGRATTEVTASGAGWNTASIVTRRRRRSDHAIGRRSRICQRLAATR